MSDPFRAFVERMAALTTPRDPEELEKRRDMMKRDGYDDEITDDDVIADLSINSMEDEASALWRLIEDARGLLK